MKRNKKITKDSIITMAKRLEWGDTYFKIDHGSIAEALIEARYIIEHGVSSSEYKAIRERKSDDFMRDLVRGKIA